ncbi:hypothetical protein AAIR98_001499 [Elusimicrobium simillimum]|uniref:hypothetical protein n=1 Tax=Elusimicrobium simillimum TaxID=3143438 RepID=UPI003C6F4A4B
MKKYFLILIVFILAQSSFGQSFIKDANKKIDAARAQLNAPAAAATPAYTAPWYTMAAENISDYFNKNAKFYSNNEELFNFYSKILAAHDMVFFGEIHTYPYPRYKTMQMIMKYNRQHPGAPIINIFYEEDESFQYKIDAIAAGLEPLSPQEKTEYCKQYSKNDIHVPEETMCLVLAEGIKIWFIDLDHDKSVSYIKNTNVRLEEQLGFDMRNRAMFAPISKAMVKNQKSVFFGGQQHVYYRDWKDNSRTLTQMAQEHFRNKKFTVVLHSGGSWHHSKSIFTRFVLEPQDYTTYNGPADAENFVEWQIKEYFEKPAILKIIPQGQENNKAYNARPADYLITYPTALSYKKIKQ